MVPLIKPGAWAVTVIGVVPVRPFLGLDVVAEALLEYRDGHRYGGRSRRRGVAGRSRLVFPLLSVTVAPPWFVAPSTPDTDTWSPLPTVAALSVMPGCGLTVTLMLSGWMLAAVTLSCVVHGKLAVPP